MYGKILVPVDLGHMDSAARILTKARALADAGAHMTVLNVQEEIPSYVMSYIPEGTTEKNLQAAETSLQELMAKAGVSADLLIRSGKASTRILDVAEEIGADLIILGSHRPGLQDYLIGSNAARVVRHATCAVLVDR
ncbi:universal stress protein [Oceanomicrobium pacificus]|uniref:Universal stress protein n=1 Tax=Oceanomicrobium pacificus TaxID=2692916 RepID=A0A6B0TPI2_9RHOB|nr:universal stress protein [Oceanomicrobium pacificus]MXU66560.1 universal stress protein [Oceanomicrobium pacificus]